MSWTEIEGRVVRGGDGLVKGVYDLTKLPDWRPRDKVADVPEVDAKPHVGLARWSGARDQGMALPPAIGQRVVVTMNGFGPGVVKGYFVEHGWLGVYVRVDNPPKWWLEQMARNGKDFTELFGGPMVFGAEMEGVGR